MILKVSKCKQSDRMCYNFILTGVNCCVLCRHGIPTLLIKTFINEKGHLLFLFVLLRDANWILRSSRSTDVTETHVAPCLNVPPRVVWAGRKLECGRHIDVSQLLRSSFEFAPLCAYIQNSNKDNLSLLELLAHVPVIRWTFWSWPLYSLTKSFFNDYTIKKNDIGLSCIPMKTCE